MIRPTLTLLLASTLGLSVAAQGRHVFDVDSPQSAFTFGGSLTYLGIMGQIVGNPSTFNVSGAIDADLTVAGGVLTNGELVAGGSLVVVPPLSAFVPNPIPFLPPLATVTVTGATVEFTSAPFAVGGGGAFATMVVATLRSGTATINSIAGNLVVPLTDISATPQPLTGTIQGTASGFDLSVANMTTFMFNDPTTGASGSLNLSGNVRGSDRDFAVDTGTVSLANGGTQSMRLSAGAARGGSVYFVVGSATGTMPGTMLNGVPIPLNPDSYTGLTVTGANALPFLNTFANLDGLGVATAGWSIPPLPIPALAGLVFDHAYVVFDASSNVIFASNPVRLTLAP